MQTDKLTHPLVKRALLALDNGDAKTWFGLFTPDAELYDDGNKVSFVPFFTKALGHERFKTIDKVEHEGLHIYGQFHSDQWGDFRTYFKFYVNEGNKIYRLEIGQAG